MFTKGFPEIVYNKPERQKERKTKDGQKDRQKDRKGTERDRVLLFKKNDIANDPCVNNTIHSEDRTLQ